jgi:hypothetical protein
VSTHVKRALCQTPLVLASRALLDRDFLADQQSPTRGSRRPFNTSNPQASGLPCLHFPVLVVLRSRSVEVVEVVEVVQFVEIDLESARI